MKYLKQLKTVDFIPEKKYDFLIPLGATEQHGPFIPLGTDTYITDAIISSISDKYQDVIVLPTLEYSKSKEHSGFPGTVWLSEETLHSVLGDICDSLQKYAKSFIMTSFHANDELIRAFIAERTNKDYSLHHLELCNEEDTNKIAALLGGAPDEHAGNTEISNILYLYPELVQIPNPDFPKQLIENPWATNDIKDFTATGIADNHPKWIVTAVLGQKVLEIYSNRANKNLQDILKIAN